MTIVDLKTEIQKALNEVPDAVLVDVLNYINKLKEVPAGSTKLMAHLDQILSEDKELLEKLAQ